MTTDDDGKKDGGRDAAAAEFDLAGQLPRAFVPPAEEASVTLTTEHIERILSNFVAAHGGVRTPFAYTVKWLWSPDKGPLAHVSVSRASGAVKPMPSRIVRKKGTSKP